MDAVILCGDKGASRMVEGERKAFLYIHGAPLFMYVVHAAIKVERVSRIFIVGDKEKLDYHLSQIRWAPLTKPVTTIEQAGSLLENIWSGFVSTIDNYQEGMEAANPEVMRKYVLFLPGDAPLMTPEEINEFLDKADMDSHDYVAGFTPSEVMEKYYPTRDKPGIRMAYVHFREGLFRINNMHLARPFLCRNKDVIQVMYVSRYQKDMQNILRLAKDMWEHHVNLQSLMQYTLLQLAMFLSFARMTFLSDMVRRRVTMAKVAKSVSKILGMRTGWAVTERGGAALDVDNNADYETMKAMFMEWRSGLG